MFIKMYLIVLPNFFTLDMIWLELAAKKMYCE